MHMHENCSKRCAHVACLLSTRRGHSSHAMLGKASASATLTVRRRPSRQPEASARAPSGPPVPSEQLQQIHAGIAARQRRRRRTAAQQGPAPRTRSLANHWTTQRRQKRLAPKLARNHARHRQEACPVKLRWRPPPQHRSAAEGTPDALEAKPPPQALRELEGQPGESTTATTHKHPRASGPPTLAPEPPATKAAPRDSQGHAYCGSGVKDGKHTTTLKATHTAQRRAETPREAPTPPSRVNTRFRARSASPAATAPQTSQERKRRSSSSRFAAPTRQGRPSSKATDW